MKYRPLISQYLLHPFTTYFILGLILVNGVAIFQFDPFHVPSFLAFIYILVTPGFLILPLLTKKKLPPFLGITLSVTLSILALMVIGFGINSILPLFNIFHPLTTTSFLTAFDLFVYVLLVLNFEYKENSPFELHHFSKRNWHIGALATLLPILSCFGAIELNDGGSNILAMLVLVLIFILVTIMLHFKDELNPTIPPYVLYMMALALLLMNSMRGSYITGHDILLEYHIFLATNLAHFWDIVGYRDPYTACLSITILPTFIQNLIHASDLYIYKFYIQFIGAFAVIPIYYLSKKYTSDAIAFLTGFLYVSFPTFMVDMAFLNRQGIGFLFFGMLIYVLLSTEYFSKWKREIMIFLLSLGMVLSHYSTSYVAVALFAGAYAINKILRFCVNTRFPKFIFKTTRKLPNIEIYTQPVLLTWYFVSVLLLLIFLWSTVITKTSSNVSATIGQIVYSVEHPFNFDDYSGAAKYSLTQSKQKTSQELFKEFVQQEVQQVTALNIQSDLFPQTVTQSYAVTLLTEPTVPLTRIGVEIQSFVQINLNSFYDSVKQVYARILQILLLVGIIGLGIGYSFRKNIRSRVSVEYIALSFAAIGLMAAQTILPASAINYGLLRLFQQNLIFLALPIIMGLVYFPSLLTRSRHLMLVFTGTVLLFFFIILSGLFPQLTGGSRPPLPLNNYGFYYDAYYTHAEEVSAIQWLHNTGDLRSPVQSDHFFSSIKLIAYGNIAPLTGLLPEIIRKNSYVYLNTYNAKTGDIIEFVNGDVFYYRFPLDFLDQNKNLIYDNGGSKIYR